MLHTIIPEEMIFDDINNNNNYNQYIEIEYQGKTIIVKDNKDNYQIERVISTDVADFLDSSLSPGNFIAKTFTNM
jgi:predicted nucleic acid-binding protein